MDIKEVKSDLCLKSFVLSPFCLLFVLQSFAENTMNELLGWYGYDKVELRDSDNLDIGEMPQHISVLKGRLAKQMVNWIIPGLLISNNITVFCIKAN